MVDVRSGYPSSDEKLSFGLCSGGELGTNVGGHLLDVQAAKSCWEGPSSTICTLSDQSAQR